MKQPTVMLKVKLFMSINIVCLVNSQVLLEVNVSKLRKLNQVGNKFLSVAIDSHVVAENWKNFDFNCPRVAAMAKALSPAFLRLGGTAADLLTFKPHSRGLNPHSYEAEHSTEHLNMKNESSCWCSETKVGTKLCENLNLLYKKRKTFILTGKDLQKLYNFSEKTGMTLLFDLNLLKRRGQHWDTRNARTLLRYAEKRNMSNIAWELGNEPNSFRHVFNLTMDPRQLGKDFWALKRLLAKFPMFERSTLVGPDVNGLRKCSTKETSRRCRALKYLGKVVQSSQGALDAMTWHHYYLNGRTATLDQFTSPAILDTLEDILDTVNNFTQSAHLFKPLWLGETSSAYGGGAHGLSNRFVAGYNWLDKLGMTAQYGYQVIIRQSFYHGCYALIGEDLEPFPDFWLSALYKKLVGHTVLSLGTTNRGKSVRLYAHCTAEGAGSKEGSVTLFGLNMGSSAAFVDLGTKRDVDAYELTPEGGNVTSGTVLLNGQALRLVGNQSLPQLKPIGSQSRRLKMSPRAMVFWVIQSKTALCV